MLLHATILAILDGHGTLLGNILPWRASGKSNAWSALSTDRNQ